MGTLSETAEFETEAQRGVRAREQEKGDESPTTLRSIPGRETREVLAGVGGRVAQERSGRRPKEGSQRQGGDGARRLSPTERDKLGTRLAFLPTDFRSS